MIAHLLAAGFLSIAVTESAGAPPEAITKSSAEVRRRISTALTTPFPETPIERHKQARAFLELYTSAATTLPAAERGRLQLRLKSRLTRLADAIRKEGLETINSSGGSQTVSFASAGAQHFPDAPGRGGGPQDDGQALVELIQATIAPQSWDVNGGTGTIKYWPAWHALVVRQTDDVHEQIGGVARQMHR